MSYEAFNIKKEIEEKKKKKDSKLYIGLIEKKVSCNSRGDFYSLREGVDFSGDFFEKAFLEAHLKEGYIKEI